MGFLSKLFNREIDVNANVGGTVQNVEESVTPVESTTVENTASVGNGTSSLVIEDVFSITGRGTVVTGRVNSGSFAVGDTIFINGVAYQIDGIEQFRKMITVANTGDNVGILISGLKRDDVVKGDIISK